MSATVAGSTRAIKNAMANFPGFSGWLPKPSPPPPSPKVIKIYLEIQSAAAPHWPLDVAKDIDLHYNLNHDSYVSMADIRIPVTGPWGSVRGCVLINHQEMFYVNHWNTLLNKGMVIEVKAGDLSLDGKLARLINAPNFFKSLGPPQAQDVPVSITTTPKATGFSCKRCNQQNDYAEANQPDGSYVCFNCR